MTLSIDFSIASTCINVSRSYNHLERILRVFRVAGIANLLACTPSSAKISFDRDNGNQESSLSLYFFASQALQDQLSNPPLIEPYRRQIFGTVSAVPSGSRKASHYSTPLGHKPTTLSLHVDPLLIDQLQSFLLRLHHIYYRFRRHLDRVQSSAKTIFYLTFSCAEAPCIPPRRNPLASQLGGPTLTTPTRTATPTSRFQTHYSKTILIL